MIDLILDTNIWISYIAQDKPTGIFDDLKSYVKNGEINLLSNQVILDEWNRNRNTTKNSLSSEISGLTKNILAYKNLLPEGEISNFQDVLNSYSRSEKERMEAAEKRIAEIDKMLIDAEQTEITREMKATVADWALEKRAPFIKKNNSVGDALILLSSAKHRIENKRTSPQGFFVTFNHTDYSEKEDKDEIHGDLKNILQQSNLIYKRHIGEVLSLAPDILMEIENWIDHEIERGKESRRGL